MSPVSRISHWKNTQLLVFIYFSFEPNLERGFNTFEQGANQVISRGLSQPQLLCESWPIEAHC